MPEITEGGILFALLLFCPLCGSKLEHEEDIPEVKRCPIGHGITYVYDNGDDHQVVAFEPAVLFLPESETEYSNREWYMTRRGNMVRNKEILWG